VSGVDARPGVDDREDLHRLEVGQSEVVGFGKGQDVAFAGDALGSEEEVREASGSVSQNATKVVEVFVDSLPSLLGA